MKGLRAIRSRVERLENACGMNDEEVLFIHWRNPYDNCPGCGYDLDTHASELALEKAKQADGPDAPRTRVIVTRK